MKAVQELMNGISGILISNVPWNGFPQRIQGWEETAGMSVYSWQDSMVVPARATPEHYGLRDVAHDESEARDLLQG